MDFTEKPFLVNVKARVYHVKVDFLNVSATFNFTEKWSPWWKFSSEYFGFFCSNFTRECLGSILEILLTHFQKQPPEVFYKKNCP